MVRKWFHKKRPCQAHFIEKEGSSVNSDISGEGVTETLFREASNSASAMLFTFHLGDRQGKGHQARPGRGTANFGKGAESRRRLRETVHKFQEGRIRAWDWIKKKRNEIKTLREGGFLVNAGQSAHLLCPRKGLLLPPPAPEGNGPCSEGNGTAASQEKAEVTFVETDLEAMCMNHTEAGSSVSAEPR